ncbi:hypothetical protein ACQPT2_03165 [Erwinia amylovora]
MYSRRRFILTGLGVGAAAVCKPGFSFVGDSTSLLAGSGQASVELAGLYPLGEFVAEHDPLAVRVLLLESAGQRQAIAVVDLTSLTAEVIARMKAILTDITGVTTGNTVICASHSFSTPHIFLEPEHVQGNAAQTLAALNAFEDALRKAAKQALTLLQPARLGAGGGYCRAGVNRNVATPEGWWLGADDAGYTDSHVGVLRINGRNGKPLAVLINYAVQPAVMDASQQASGGRLISADMAGATSRHIERYFGGNTVAFYLVGCAGDQVPYLQASRHVVNANGSVGRIDIHEQGFPLVDLMGQRLGEEVIRVAETISATTTCSLNLQRSEITLPGQKFSPRNAPVGPVKKFIYEGSSPVQLPVILMQWGDTVLVGVQPELSANIGAYIRAVSPFASTFIMTMADGADKYLPDRANYDHFTYEARSSPYARGAAEQAAEDILRKLHRLKALSA